MSARIYQIQKNAMQSGKALTHKWVLEFAQAEAKMPDPLTGWAGSGDTQSQVKLTFATQDAAIAYADKRFYCQSERDGAIVLIEASPEGWKERGRFVLTPQTLLRKKSGKIWTHPVITNGKLYLRDQELLFCFDVRGKGN